MKDEDIIGKEFICFEFKDDPKLCNYSTYKSMIGLSAVVINVHKTSPQYTNCKVTFSDGRTQRWHYPTDLVKKQIEENETPVDLDAILLQIKNLTP
jgi:hypothetical protein